MPHYPIPTPGNTVAFYYAHERGQLVRQGPANQAEGKLFIQASIRRDTIPGQIDMTEASFTQWR
ncbi:hypothetical protein D3C81_1053300 [compost metagenome]